MTGWIQRLGFVFSAGAAGGLANSIAVWLFGAVGITKAVGVALAPQLTAAWLYPRVVWGGLWGVLFLIPYLRSPLLLRGLVFSLGPTIIQLFVVFPYKANKGFLGLDLGLLAPLFVIIYNAVWGLTAVYLLHKTETKT